MTGRWTRISTIAAAGSLLFAAPVFAESESAPESKGTITVAASATPHAEILEEAAKYLEEEGWELEVTVFNDYVQPNLVVDSGDFDANYFQHIPYLDNFNEERGTKLVNAGGIHYEPFGIYPGTKSSLDEIEKGDVIAVPNDTTNEARALLLLQDNGIITLKEGVGLEATVLDIEENPYDIKIQELEAAQVPRVIDEVAYAVMNGNYALEANFSVSRDSIAYEQSDSEAAKTYVNVIAVKEGNEDAEGIVALVNVLKSDEIRAFIEETYDGAVIPFVEEKEAEEKGTITVAASATPHAEILEEAAKYLEEEGWELEVTVFNDYVQPNLVVDSGDFDANYFQHIPYLDNFNEERGTKLVNAGGIHYEPFGIYPGTKSSLDEIEKGDVIAVPNDTTNEARALLLLQDNGIITLKEGVGLEATVLDIEENPYDIKIQELEAAQVPRVIDEVAYAVMNGNYALEANFSVSRDSIAYEQSDSEAAKTYVNVIAVKEGNEDAEGIVALVNVLKSDEIRTFIEETYDGAVIPYVEE